nr:MAG TPA: portal protein [Caudoviricetes sp.]
MEPMTLQKPKIGAEEVRRAAQILKKYKQGKAHLESRIIDNEQFWKMRHWQQMEKNGQGGNPGDPQPASAWLVNCILSKHADAMDCYPAPTVLPREPDDRQEAQRLSRILPVVLKKNQFKRTYSSAWWYKLKSGCAVYGVFWDGTKLGELGDISVKRMDLLNLFWEPGVTDIQDSAHFFSTELVDNDKLLAEYPQLEGKLGRGNFTLSRYLYDDTVDTSNKSLVVDWYYHTNMEGRKVLQYCKYVGETVLYATENDTVQPTETQLMGADENGRPVMGQVPCGPSMAQRGWYDHGKYPFVFDVLFPEEGTPCGYGYIDLCKSPQKQIDLMNQAILKNTLANATPRFFIRSDGAVNENEYADWTRPFVHTNGNLGSDSIAPIRAGSLDSVYVAILNNKIGEMKETAGNRDVANGGTASGVTAGTAIAALQESSGKLSRNMIDDGYEAFADVVTLCIELIRQFYELPRQFRLLGAMGTEEFVSYDHSGLQPRVMDDGVTVSYRVPEFDLEIGAERESPYRTAEANQLALQLFQMGFFRDDLADQALRCLELMEFKNKDQLARVISGGQTQARQIAALRQQLLQLAQVVDEAKGTHLAESLSAEKGGGQNAAASAGKAVQESHSAMERSRQQSREVVRPR